jgi:hypothetical protein
MKVLRSMEIICPIPEVACLLILRAQILKKTEPKAREFGAKRAWIEA